ncbi:MULTISPECIES: inorganic diphosphatase [unclassified Mesorhizobium]|uniref:inorganic diphosphatase n=1 Tax=unclassified Mesorhizobium TaxID=325217 RepID=UPI000F75D52E|nr:MULTISPECIES: inorganic diphosphatase [unclassified Mesorhizobium]AZO71292.1 inorganic pyrophosphatase [Mesorhizobium sp. M1D.F.Ca.ET.043.01.1.1]RWA94532.1 MAG: inorganic pyrophosphatase [Mesorhizobium sp.]
MPDYEKLPTMNGDQIRVVVETPRGAAAKFSYDPKTGVFEFTRPLPVGNTYPYDWGFVPSTIGEDGDPLDGLIIHQAASAPGIVINCDLLGALRVKQKDSEGSEFRNDRFVFRPHKQDSPDKPATEESVPEELRREIEQFFKSSVLGTDKTIRLKGWRDATEASALLRKGMNSFARKKRRAR